MGRAFPPLEQHESTRLLLSLHWLTPCSGFLNDPEPLRPRARTMKGHPPMHLQPPCSVPSPARGATPQWLRGAREAKGRWWVRNTLEFHDKLQRNE